MVVVNKGPVDPLPEVFPYIDHDGKPAGDGPLMVQLVALVELHLSVALLPETIVEGEAEMEAVGTVEGGTTMAGGGEAGTF